MGAIAGLTVTVGHTLPQVIPLRRVQQLTAIALIILAAYSFTSALTGWLCRTFGDSPQRGSGLLVVPPIGAHERV